MDLIWINSGVPKWCLILLKFDTYTYRMLGYKLLEYRCGVLSRSQIFVREIMQMTSYCFW